MPKDINFYIAQIAGTLALNAAQAMATADAAGEYLAAKDTEIAALKAELAKKAEPSA